MLLSRHTGFAYGDQAQRKFHTNLRGKKGNGMIVGAQSYEDGSYFYSHYIEKDTQQYLYGSDRPWFYIFLLAIAICRRVENLKAIFFAEDETFVETVHLRGDYCWTVMADGEAAKSDEANLVLPLIRGAALYPATRWGLRDAAQLMFYSHERHWCRLAFNDTKFQERLQDGSLKGAPFVQEIDRRWVVGLWASYEHVFFDVGPEFSRFDTSLFATVIAEVNEQCI